jgi:hypothetical protein
MGAVATSGPLAGYDLDDVARLRQVVFFQIAINNDSEAKTGERLLQALNGVFFSIDSHRKQRSNVFVHCRHGQTRSVCLTVCYLTRYMSLTKAFERMGELHRPGAKVWDRIPSFRSVCITVDTRIGYSKGRPFLKYPWDRKRVAKEMDE